MMHYLVYFSMGFIAFQFVNVLLNFVFRQSIKKASSPINGNISVLIPARNEEVNIGHLLKDLSNIKNENLEIIVFDDQSTDQTANIVDTLSKIDKRIKLLTSQGLPDGWLGKNYACYQLAQNAKGAHYLFLDADVRVHANIIEDSVAYLVKYKLALLSIFPLQIKKTLGEKLTVPIMNYILLSLLPLILVRLSPFSSHSAANGQFMLFDAAVYKKLQPHKKFKTSAVEDIAISRYFKKRNLKIACITGEKRIKCRMYKSYKEAKDGFTKNVFMFFGNQAILAFLFLLFTGLGFIPILVSEPNYLAVYLIFIIIIQALYSITSRQNVLLNILLFPVQLVFLFQVMIKSSLMTKNKQYLWKGRNIYS